MVFVSIYIVFQSVK